MSEVRVKGLSELARFLDTFPDRLQRNVMRGALRAGMRPVLIAARSGIRSISGDLAKSLRIVGSSRGDIVKASVRTNDFTARFVEYGTAAHWISPKGMLSETRFATKRGARLIGGRAFNQGIKRGSLKIGVNFASAIYHPGARAKPFMRPALDSQAQAAVIATGEYIKQRLANKHGLDTSAVNLTGENE